MNKAKGALIKPILTALLIISTMLFTVSFSIGLPIYAREFYYMQISPLDIENECGKDRETVIEGYDEVLDYLTKPNKSFSAGEFKYSDNGAKHFADCKSLFTLNAVIYIISVVIIAVLLTLKRLKLIEFSRPLGLISPFWSGAVTLLVFAALGIAVFIDFDTAFYVFHRIFFPGKDNWMFNPYTDEIILAMPGEFFMHCAILIGSSVIILSLILIALGIIKKLKSRS